MKKLVKNLGVMMLIASIALITLFTTTVRADERDEPSSIDSLVINKHYRMPEGTPGRLSIFTFVVTRIGALNSAGELIPGSAATMPVLTASPSITLFSGSASTTADGITTLIGASNNLLQNAIWPGPGHYVFHIHEQPGIAGSSIPEGSVVDFDDTVFEVHMIVSEINGTLTVVGLYIWNSVDEDRSLTNETGKVESVLFTNTYIPTTELIVSKQVSGALSMTTSDFSFTVNFTGSDLTSSLFDPDILPAITAHIRNSNGTGIETAVTLPVTNVNLRHGQELIFRNVPIGYTFVATEDPGDYVPSINLTLAGADVIPPPEGATTGDRIIGSDVNIAAFTNTNDAVPITGIIMNSLPFILVGLAAAGVFVMIVVNKRRRDVYE